MTLFKIGNTDLTKYIEDDSYNVVSEPEYEEWKDGNYNKHRIYVRDRIKGSINVICSNKTITKENFLKLLKNNIREHKLMCHVYVTNKNEEKIIECFFSIEPSLFRKDVVVYSLTLEEE